MANDISPYNPTFYALAGLRLLENNLGMASRVHRGYDATVSQKGSVIEISKPMALTAAAMPASDTDLTPSIVSITLDQWWGTTIALTDKELSHTKEKIIEDHVRPMVYGVVNEIDQQLCQQALNIPWFRDVDATASVTDLVQTRKIMEDNKVPVHETNRMHMMGDTDMMADWLGQTAFSQHQGGGDAAVSAQASGIIGPKFGFDVFGSQNAISHTAGTASTPAVLTNGTPAAGATTFSVDAGTLTGTVVPGDTFVIAGNSQRYAITNTVTASANAMANITFTPGLAAAPGDGASVTLSLDDHSAGVAFHTNWCALAMAPLSELGNGKGADISVVQDASSGLSLRARTWYDGDAAKLKVSMDALFGIKQLDANLAVRMRNTV